MVRARGRARGQLPGVGCWPRLTDTEQRVFETVLDCDTTAEIAGKLYMSQATAKKHIGSILRKLGVRSRHRAVTWGLRLGLISHPGANHTPAR